ncbi:hypothetical protein L596_024047 [Steinernema carpocapsae]|uniref:Uncharacterized protein n=1 Tax=Steinernema carpocapsae TaxID=34508 RepID=A0A4U5MFJ4_STECR|nr:hypothetical protein L596_024047 [Steinernema carpocapsae]
MIISVPFVRIAHFLSPKGDAELVGALGLCCALFGYNVRNTVSERVTSTFLLLMGGFIVLAFWNSSHGKSHIAHFTGFVAGWILAQPVMDSLHDAKFVFLFTCLMNGTLWYKRWFESQCAVDRKNTFVVEPVERVVIERSSSLESM